MTCVRLPKENHFCSNNAPEIHIFNYWRHQKLLLVASQLQDSSFLFEINSEDIGISKLVSQLSYCQVYLNLKKIIQLLWVPLLKNCKICHEIEVS